MPKLTTDKSNGSSEVTKGLLCQVQSDDYNNEARAIHRRERDSATLDEAEDKNEDVDKYLYENEARATRFQEEDSTPSAKSEDRNENSDKGEAEDDSDKKAEVKERKTYYKEVIETILRLPMMVVTIESNISDQQTTLRTSVYALRYPDQVYICASAILSLSYGILEIMAHGCCRQPRSKDLTENAHQSRIRHLGELGYGGICGSINMPIITTGAVTNIDCPILSGPLPVDRLNSEYHLFYIAFTRCQKSCPVCLDH